MKRWFLPGLLIPLLLPLALYGQAVRFSGNGYTINTSSPQPGALYPVLATTSPTIGICASSPTATCAATATTYPDATEAISCSSIAQLTPPTSGGCTASVDNTGNFGGWIAPGTYQYVVTTSLGTFGPYPFTVGSGTGGSGSVTNFSAPSGSWPAWLVPTVTNATTTPSITVAASPIPYTAFTTLSANQVLGALTATTPSGLTMPSCSGGPSALTWTTGTGFGCNTITAGSTPFSAITSGLNNTGQTLTVGSASSLTFGGSGIINASQINGITVTGTPSTGQVITATSPTAANWQTPSGGGGIPSGTANQLLYYASSGTTVTPLTLGSNLSITSGVLNASSSGPPAWSASPAGTNTNALIVGTGGSLTTSGSGSINATLLGGVALSGLCQTGGTGCPQLPVTKAATAHQWLNSYTSSTGIFTATQPAFTDISGQATLAQLPNGTSNSVLLGYGASGSGSPPVQITLGTGLSMSGTTLNATGGGSGLPCSGTCTAGTVGLFGSGGTSITNSHLDETTNAGEDTFSQPVVVNATSAPSQFAITYDSITPTVGSSTTAVFAATSSGVGELSSAGGAFSPIATLAAANVFTANQTAPSFIAAGSGAGALYLTAGTAPGSIPTSSIGIFAPASVPTAYSITLPSAPPGVTNDILYTCTGSTAATCKFNTAVTLGSISGYTALSLNANVTGAGVLGFFGDPSGSDKAFYFNSPSGSNQSIQFKFANVTGVVFLPGSAPTGSCSGDAFEISLTDGHGTWCNGSTWTTKF